MDIRRQAFWRKSDAWIPTALAALFPECRTLLATQREDGIFTVEVTRPDQPPNVFNPTGTPPYSDASDTYFSLNVSSEGKHFVISGDENTVRLWELGIDTPIGAFPIQEKAMKTFSPAAI